MGEPDTKKDDFPAIYITGNKCVGFYGQGIDSQVGAGNIRFDEKAQYDIVYEDRTVKAYINSSLCGSVSTTKDAANKLFASLGNRIKDNSRALKAIYYSFIVYDKALDKDKILHNLSVNQTRYDVSGGE